MNRISEWIDVVRSKRYKIRDVAAGPYTLSETTLWPNQSTRGHHHERDEVYYFRGGTGRMWLGDGLIPHTVSPGQVVYVRPNEYHRLDNPDPVRSTPLRFVSFFVGEPGRPEVKPDD